MAICILVKLSTFLPLQASCFSHSCQQLKSLGQKKGGNFSGLHVILCSVDSCNGLRWLQGTLTGSSHMPYFCVQAWKQLLALYNCFDF